MAMESLARSKLMGLFGEKSVSAEQVKQIIRPTLEIAQNVFDEFENIDISNLPRGSVAMLESELKELNLLNNILSKIYLFYGVSTQQVMEITNDIKISSPVKWATDQSFIAAAKELMKYEDEICIILKSLDFSFDQAIEFHKHAWQTAKISNPGAMDTLKSVRTNGMHWDWINAGSWSKVGGN